MYENFTSDDVSVIDIEANGLDDATVIHLIVIKTGKETEVFRDVTSDRVVREAVRGRLAKAKILAGHNILGFDLPTLSRLCGIEVACPVLDTLVLVRLLNYGLRGGHSLEAWGKRLGVAKAGTGITDWSVRTAEMESRCLSDVEINHKLMSEYRRIWSDPKWQDSLRVEHFVARMCVLMHKTGFPFDEVNARALHQQLSSGIETLDLAIRADFGPRAVPIREITPRRTKAGTLNRADFRWYDGSDLSVFDGGPFTLFEYVPFNAGSHRQIVERLNDAGWKPTDKTDGHKDALKDKSTPAEKVAEYKKFGWKISEENLATLPASAPPSAFKLAERLTIASRLSDLDEWLGGCVDGTIYGNFQPIGAWTHRLSHQKPNTANIPQYKPNEKHTPFQKEVQLLNKKMRTLFLARKGYRLIGTDADSIQMRIFAHMCEDQELIDAINKGSKDNGTDVHSLNKRLLGSVCGSRDVAKTFIYAFLLGAGAGKIAEILECSLKEAKAAVAQFIASLPGLARLKRDRIPKDAASRFFTGLDGRLVVCDSEHLMMSGYLQNGEKVIMSHAMEIWYDQLVSEGLEFYIHDWVHDEWQTGVPDEDDVCSHIQKVQCDALLKAGEKLGLMLPTPGSSDWGYNWSETH